MTAQIHEELILDGEATSMAFCPPLPENDPRIVPIDPDEAPGDEESDMIMFSTVCWRGYQGTWEIRDGRFFLKALRGRFRLHSQEPILAHWFSGVLRIPQGEVLQYVHMGFGSVHEQELHVKIEQGVVAATRVVDNRGKHFDGWELRIRNLPGGENQFPGDDEL